MAASAEQKRLALLVQRAKAMVKNWETPSPFGVSGNFWEPAWRPTTKNALGEPLRKDILLGQMMGAAYWVGASALAHLVAGSPGLRPHPWADVERSVFFRALGSA